MFISFFLSDTLCEMEPVHRNLLQSNHIRLKEILGEAVLDVLNFLWEKNIITKQMKDRVEYVSV